ncbi:acyl-CoA dehydrogenase domain-containing protein [Macrophomina phaseolina]|uniref:Acyl-CoA dehydrogenase domain-containing protein n=1 Tax=Macrophomina phaseolina TaxID=35725 RepID=A0ABQ8G5C6_9PEZI|nr:acyl-CoA dehydrogenase domain-containing protein [Macrophomina phaseolina]
MVDFTLSPSEAATRTAARAFAHAHLRTAPALYGSIPATRPDLRFQSLKPIYEAAVAGGLIKGMVPKELGGAMGSLVEMCVCVEECYAVDPTASLTIFGTGLGLAPLLAAWREGLEPFLEPFLRGTGAPVASLVYSEPGGVANWLEPGAPGLQTTAYLDGDEWVLSGEKLWATNSAGFDFRGADLACVVCRCTNADAQAAATRPEDLIMVLLVTPADIARNAAGSFEVLQHPQTAGHTAVSGPHIRYAGLRVPQGNLLCAPGTGVPVVTGAFQMSAALVGAMGTGIGRAAFDAALAFAKGDARGGSVPIVEHQSVADLLINIKMRTETSRYLTWKAAQALTSGKGHELALEAKIYCSDAAVKSAIDAINLVGVSAYDTSRPFTGFLNDAMVLPIFDGGNVGIRRRDLQKLFMSKDYSPWGASLE